MSRPESRSPARRSPAARPDPDQPRQQRHQVHRARRDPAQHRTARAHGREGAPEVLRAGHRHRHDPRAGGKAVPAVHAGRHVHHAQARRHRAGPDDLPATGGADGRPHLARERAGRRQHVLLHRLAGRRRVARARAGLSPSSLRHFACWWWTTTPPRGRSSRSRSAPSPSTSMLVASGPEAIAAVKAAGRDRNPFDIVFMDWRMPGMDGLQASRLIKSDETLSKQPAIVMVTAFGREEVREEAERLEPRRLPRQAGHQVHDRGHAGERVRRAGRDAARSPPKPATSGQAACTGRGSCWPRTTRSTSRSPSNCSKASARRVHGRQQRARGRGDSRTARRRRLSTSS